MFKNVECMALKKHKNQLRSTTVSTPQACRWQPLTGTLITTADYNISHQAKSLFLESPYPQQRFVLCLTDFACSRIIFLFYFSLSVLSHHHLLHHSFHSLDLVILLAPPNLTALPFFVFVLVPPPPPFATDNKDNTLTLHSRMR